MASHKKSLNIAEKIFEKVSIDGPGEIEWSERDTKGPICIT